MGAIYSHSRLASFENCPKQFEFRYIQKRPRETESIEAFVGKRVHEVLERLYKCSGARGQIVPTLEQVDGALSRQLFDAAYDAAEACGSREIENDPRSFYRDLGEHVACANYYITITTPSTT